MEDPGELSTRLSSLRVGDVMTKDIVSVPPDCGIPEVARLLRANHIHRVLVVDPTNDEEELAGIVTLFDLVSLLE